LNYTNPDVDDTAVTDAAPATRAVPFTVPASVLPEAQAAGGAPGWRRTVPPQIAIQRDQATPLHAQIAAAILDDLRARKMPPGTQMPPSRDLARLLGVDRKTVVTAYDDLVAQGWLRSEPKRGTFVAGGFFDAAAGLVEGEDGLHADAAALPGQGAAAGTVGFHNEAADVRLLPLDLQWQAVRRSLHGRRAVSGLHDPLGSPVLRRLLQHRLAEERDVHRQADGLCLVRSVHMALYLAARVLVRPGDRVAVAAIGSAQVRAVFSECGADMLAVPHDQDGLQPEALQALIHAGGPVRAVYVEPSGHFPTAARLSPARRVRLLELAEQHGFFVVENDSGHEFSWADGPNWPLASIDPACRVVHVATVSPLMAPDLQPGYVLAGSDVLARVAALNGLLDPQGHAIAAAACIDLMRSGELTRHTRRAVRVCEQRRALLAALLQQRLPAHVQFEPPQGGLAFWLQLAPQVALDRLHADAAHLGLRLSPAARIAQPEPAPPALRLPFAAMDDDELRAGVDLLAQALAAQPGDPA
jgi:GntR family transcriptional regulator/MocR family aminotransferase